MGIIHKKLSTPLYIEEGILQEIDFDEYTHVNRIYINGVVFLPVYSLSDVTKKHFFYDIENKKIYYMI